MSKSKAIEEARNGLINFVDRMIETGVDLKDALAKAADSQGAFEKVAIEKIRVMAIVEAPKALRSISRRASKGDVKAAELILDVAGALPKGRQGNVNILNQINVPQGEAQAMDEDARRLVIDV